MLNGLWTIGPLSPPQKKQFLTFLLFQAHFQKKARNCRNVKIHFFNISAVSSLFSENVLETAEMLKLFFLGGALVPVVQKTFNIINIFNISAVSSPYFFNIQNLELTFLTFLQFRGFFFGKCARNCKNFKRFAFRGLH